MWKALSLTLALCLLAGCSAESEIDGARCKLPPVWKIGEEEPTKNALGHVTVVAYLQATKLLMRPCFSNPYLVAFLILENQGYININYMVVNNRDERSQQLHHLLKERLMNITLYAQDLSQPDVWQAVNAEKDDILVYDRCGRLTYHLSLPYTNLSHPHVEEAIRLTYCDGICGECSIELNTSYKYEQNKNIFFLSIIFIYSPSCY
uniref:Selenoprotein P N-terminal domain-containing protein n=1 Tax=Sinocyclocheilus anshuiensis TaxID=1608454 RepID=A0A671PHS2_9TELE